MDFKEIKELIKIFDKSDLFRLKLKTSEFEIALQKGAPKLGEPSAAAPSAPQITGPATQEKDELEAAKKKGEYITSPMVGTFYRAPSPDSPPFVKVGDVVSKGQTIGII